MRNKKTMIAIISVVALLLVLIGVTYAYWLVTKTQTNSNIISSACLDITMDNEANAINLSSQYPMSDEDGMKLTPYTFTVTNNCNTSIDYQVALESVGAVEKSISSSALKVALDDSSELLSNKATAQTTVSGAYASYKLGYGTLAATGNEGSSVSHSLRIWIDENAPISESNKTYQSKISVTVGQGIQANPYEEGTLAYAILADKNPKEFGFNSFAHRVTFEGYQYIGDYSSYYYGTEYIYDVNTGEYILGGTLTQAKLSECRSGTKNCGKYTLRSEKASFGSTYLYEIMDWNSSEGNSYAQVKRIKYTNEVGSIVESEPGIYKTVDDLGNSYYFRGNVTNNYVQFGKYDANVLIGHVSKYQYFFNYCVDFCDDGCCGGDESDGYNTLEDCESDAANYRSGNGEIPECYMSEETKQEEVVTTKETPMYWRIVRINGDGTIRLVYDGVEKVENGKTHIASIGNSWYNDWTDDIDNVSYTYNNTNSTIKDKLDNWYNTYLKTNYGGYIVDGIFCNDRSIGKSDWYDEYAESTTEENGSYRDIYYSANTRLTEQQMPQLTCTRKEDRYTVNTTIGNGLLTHPVGLLTVDEVIFAGGTTSDAENKNYYLYTGYSFWTNSPDAHYSIGGGDYTWAVDFAGNLYTFIVGGEDAFGEEYKSGLGARPVINLRADVEFTGDGSYENPYVIKTN